jgi:2-dehydro-3-deoxygluconokinase
LLNIKPKSNCRWDIVSLGEVMLRFDPGDERIRTTRHFSVYEGGGEYNVARNLAKCFDLDAAVVTALANNEIGRLVEDLITQGRVDTSEIIWRNTDGICRDVRNGIYFWERGFGMRPPAGCSDRANTAISQLKPGDIDWQDIFSGKGTRWFHTGGIFAGLSETTSEVATEAMRAARESGSIVSYDLNYRDSLWAVRGGRGAANEVNRKLLEYADVIFGVESFDATLSNFNEAKFREAAAGMVGRYSRAQIIATPLRNIHSTSLHDLSGACYSDGEVFCGPRFEIISVLDRVGSGDAFAAGIVYQLLSGKGPQAAIGSGTAAAVLALSSPGDNADFQISEIVSLIDSEKKTAR